MQSATPANRNIGKPSRARRDAIYSCDDHTCIWCGRHVESGHSDPHHRSTLDHIVCVLHGGSWAAENVLTSCHSCNSRRGAKRIDKWIRILAAERTANRADWRKEITRLHARVRAAVRRHIRIFGSRS